MHRVSMGNENPQILIIGGGIGGLTLAAISDRYKDIAGYSLKDLGS